MPKGEHFKKENPRIYQVSFKVNKDELDVLKGICDAQKLSTAEFLRDQILNFDSNNEAKPKKAIVSNTMSKVESETKKKGEQMSMF